MGVRIDFARTGGFAGLTLRTSLDTDELPPEEAAEIERLAEAAMTAKGSERGGVDRFQYEFEIEGAGEKRRLTIGEGDLTPELRTLVERLVDRARKRS